MDNEALRALAVRLSQLANMEANELAQCMYDAAEAIPSLLDRVKALEEGLQTVYRGIQVELDPDWPCDSYHPRFITAAETARALLENKHE